ncbi:DMT family transporter [Sphingomonas nostoxanthinifaciens]|uniref:DMT family transporter n=1 Tax=Sphingomonas nostoxanthinifaciens TaxID=2872652 RepID=UPI001CC21854|nr:DMT family transporter [Sphingomonas nostoxanthinifaciens]UAK25207.1 DMT family transporter [Sphingomonas nostoxanthinifaciens]
MFAAFAPILFVLVWSTGFIVARLMVPHAAPEPILFARMALTALVLAALAAMRRETLPRGRRLMLHLLAGALLNGLYLCLSWWSVARGMPAGIMSLLGAAQPLIIAVASFALLGERLPGKGWLGLAIGLAGVVLVLEPLIARGSVGMPLIAVIPAIVSIAVMAAGTMIQRGELAGDPILVSGAVQNSAGAGVALLASLLAGDARWNGGVALWAGLAWSVLGLSVTGLSLLVWMVRHQGATRVSALLLLVPPLAALEAWLLFGETLLPLQLVGFALALGGVLLARVRRREAVVDPA